MSINSLACVESIVNKNQKGDGLPPIVLSMTNIFPWNPAAYWSGDAGTIVYNASGKVIAFRQTVNNQIAPYTFKNGLYYTKVSETTTTVNNQNFALYTTFMGEINNVPDTPYQSPLVYNASGVYTGSNSTVTSGVTVMGEWIQLQIPYFLYITSYQIHTNAPGAGASPWNQYFTKSYYLCASNDGVTWTTIDNKTNVSTNTSGLNYYTVPTVIKIGYKYVRLIGTQVGATKMGVMIGLGGTYRG